MTSPFLDTLFAAWYNATIVNNRFLRLTETRWETTGEQGTTISNFPIADRLGAFNCYG